jgi:hypothetical protein
LTVIIRRAARAALAAGTITATLITAAAVTSSGAGATVAIPHLAAPLLATPHLVTPHLVTRAGFTVPDRPPVPQPGHAAPLWRLAAGEHLSTRHGGQITPQSIGEPGGYDPAELRAYAGLKGTGAHQTVAITEAFNVRSAVRLALASYDASYGLRPVCPATVSTGCFRLTFADPHGTAASPSPADMVQWDIEASLDVEMVHALAPRAAILVVEAHDSALPALMAAIHYAQGTHPAAVSNSWGADEFSGERALDRHCPATGSPCVFSSGDCGSYATSSCAAGSIGGYPAADPGVLAVGGTTLDLTAAGRVVYERGWSGSGGGISAYEPMPAYQAGIDTFTGGRGIPDVSFDADPNSGIDSFLEYVVKYQGHTYKFGRWAEIGGTSVGAPAWAAILAAAGQQRAAAGNPPLTVAGIQAAVYGQRGTRPIADITVGVNGICGRLCSAGPGYDLVTGEGSPRPGIDTYLAANQRSQPHRRLTTRHA